ncbi:hypothetical protein ACFXI0_07855 [Kitasatospora indigofera]|uniref:hypothetical protein n=1 Tax=Kitasatospora indigofera TaxID=67307 RepID=UPI0036BB268A
MSSPKAPEPQYAVILTAPNYTTRRFGPFVQAISAESYQRALLIQLTSTAHPEDLTIVCAPYNPELEHTSPRPPRDPAGIAELMDEEDDTADPAARFPDLHSQLLAAYGYESAGLWKEACRYYDWSHTPGEEDDQEQPPTTHCPSTTSRTEQRDPEHRCALPTSHTSPFHVDQDGHAWTDADAEQRTPVLRLADVFAELAELRKTPREHANESVRRLLAAGDIEAATATDEAFEASEAYAAAHPRI